MTTSYNWNAVYRERIETDHVIISILLEVFIEVRVRKVMGWDSG
jgi:hypothetical protein